MNLNDDGGRLERRLIRSLMFNFLFMTKGLKVLNKKKWVYRTPSSKPICQST